MCYRRLFSAAVATAIVLALRGSPGPSAAQTAATPAVPQAKTPGLQCNPAVVADPFKGKLAGAEIPSGIIPVDDKDKSGIFASGLPCQDRATPNGLEDIGLDNLQRTFDFYSWRTFIALNSPADGSPIGKSQPDTRARWEDMDNFKQLLDVMLPAKLQPPKWPTDRAAMEAEKVRLLPEACRAAYKPGMTVVKMIEESYNEPFKTGPLIDQQGHYAIFDILMNRQMFDYILQHRLFTKAGQMSAANAGLVVDFPPGQNSDGTTGAFMLKVSYKILTPDEIKANKFHMVKALVETPKPTDPKFKGDPPCLPETLGLIGFHAVHKTASRPQWIWTSFEHVKNVPDKDEVADNKLDGPYHFFKIGCKENDCPVNATPPKQFWEPDPALQLKFKDTSFKSQIVRETPLTDAARNMNTVFHSMLHGTVWENYMLISTQWPSVFECTSLKADFQRQPDMNCSPAPTFLANSTLETYSQGDIPQASSSCIACHGNAVGFQPGASNAKPGEVRFNQSDFTFILEKAP